MHHLTHRIWLGVLLVASSISASASEYLVSTDWLEKNLKSPNVRIFEVSVDPGQFEKGHIQGAHNLRWHEDLVDPVRRDIVSRDNLERILQAAGVNQDSTIVLYGDNNNWFAAWGAWVFDVYRIPNVKLLDGGRQKWVAEGRPLSVRLANLPKGDIKVGNRWTCVLA